MRTGRPPSDPLVRFAAKIDFGETCWEWQGARVSSGYGAFQLTTRQTVRAHRLMYRLVHGPIPPDAYITHDCDNPPCCNPDHLRLGTPLSNMQEKHARGRAWCPSGPDSSAFGKVRRETHCKHGHELTPDNVLVVQGARRCRVCARLASRAAYLRRSEGLVDYRRRSKYDS